MSRTILSYDELVNQNIQELLNDEHLMDQFEENFEERLAEQSHRAEEKRIS